MKHFINYIGTILAELLLIIGAVFILAVTYSINSIAFYYLLGVIFVLMGLFVAKTRG